MAKPILLDFPDAFESERLIIRAPRPGDGVLINPAILESLEALRPWMPWAQTAPSVDESEEVMRKGAANFILRSDLPLVLLRKDTGQFIGGSGLHRMDWDVPMFEIGYWVRTSCAGQGYITEAVNAISRFAFETLKANRVEIRMDDHNRASWRVAERAGFLLEGIFRKDTRDVQGDLRDTRVYAKTRP